MAGLLDHSWGSGPLSIPDDLGLASLVLSETSNQPEVSLKFLRGFAVWLWGQGLPSWGFHPLSYRGHHLQLPGPPYAPSLPLE